MKVLCFLLYMLNIFPNCKTMHITVLWQWSPSLILAMDIIPYWSEMIPCSTAVYSTVLYLEATWRPKQTIKSIPVMVSYISGCLAQKCHCCVMSLIKVCFINSSQYRIQYIKLLVVLYKILYVGLILLNIYKVVI